VRHSNLITMLQAKDSGASPAVDSPGKRGFPRTASLLVQAAVRPSAAAMGARIVAAGDGRDPLFWLLWLFRLLRMVWLHVRCNANAGCKAGEESNFAKVGPFAGNHVVAGYVIDQQWGTSVNAFASCTV